MIDESAGARWLDLLATLRGRYRSRQVDLLADPAALGAFLAEVGLAPRVAPTAADLDAVRALREAMHAVLRADEEGRRPEAGDLALLAEAQAAFEPFRLAAGETGPVVEPPATADVAVALMVTEMLGDLSGPRRPLIRPCGDDSCSGYFLDVTGRRTWCSSARCGSRVRVRRHRSRAVEGDSHP